jgi:hypothetical protein
MNAIGNKVDSSTVPSTGSAFSVTPKEYITGGLQNILPYLNHHRWKMKHGETKKLKPETTQWLDTSQRYLPIETGLGDGRSIISVYDISS